MQKVPESGSKHRAWLQSPVPAPLLWAATQGVPKHLLPKQGPGELPQIPSFSSLNWLPIGAIGSDF